MSSGFLIFVIGLSVSLGDFPNRSLKCSFYMCIRSFWLAAFSLALGVFFLLLTLFTVCHAFRDCLSSTKFLIVLIRPWMYSIYSFWCGWLGFKVYQPLLVIWHQIHFYANSQLYFKQFSLEWVHSLIVKKVLIQLIQFSTSTDFVYTQLNIKQFYIKQFN